MPVAIKGSEIFTAACNLPCPLTGSSGGVLEILIQLRHQILVDHDILRQLCAPRHIVIAVLFLIDFGGKPIQLTGIIDLIIAIPIAVHRRLIAIVTDDAEAIVGIVQVFAGCIDGILFDQNFTTDGTVLAFRLAGSAAGFCNRRINDLGVRQFFALSTAEHAGSGRGAGSTLPDTFGQFRAALTANVGIAIDLGLQQVHQFFVAVAVEQQIFYQLILFRNQRGFIIRGQFINGNPRMDCLQTRQQALNVPSALLGIQIAQKSGVFLELADAVHSVLGNLDAAAKAAVRIGIVHSVGKGRIGQRSCAVFILSHSIEDKVISSFALGQRFHNLVYVQLACHFRHKQDRSICLNGFHSNCIPCQFDQVFIQHIRAHIQLIRQEFPEFLIGKQSAEIAICHFCHTLDTAFHSLQQGFHTHVLNEGRDLQRCHILIADQDFAALIGHINRTAFTDDRSATQITQMVTVVLLVSMEYRNRSAEGGVVAAGAILIRIVAGFHAGGVFRRNLRQIMPQCRNCDCLTFLCLATGRAVNHAFIGARCGTGRSSFVLHDRFTGFMGGNCFRWCIRICIVKGISITAADLVFVDNLAAEFGYIIGADGLEPDQITLRGGAVQQICHLAGGKLLSSLCNSIVQFVIFLFRQIVAIVDGYIQRILDNSIPIFAVIVAVLNGNLADFRIIGTASTNQRKIACATAATDRNDCCVKHYVRIAAARNTADINAACYVAAGIPALFNGATVPACDTTSS